MERNSELINSSTFVEQFKTGVKNVSQVSCRDFHAYVQYRKSPMGILKKLISYRDGNTTYVKEEAVRNFFIS